jgi:hypothetical protein
MTHRNRTCSFWRAWRSIGGLDGLSRAYRPRSDRRAIGGGGVTVLVGTVGVVAGARTVRAGGGGMSLDSAIGAGGNGRPVTRRAATATRGVSAGAGSLGGRTTGTVPRVVCRSARRLGHGPDVLVTIGIVPPR